MVDIIVNFTKFLAVGTLLMHVGIVLLMIGWLVDRLRKDGWSFYRKLIKFLTGKSVWLVLLIALASVVSSLFYSEYAKYEPCLLCWYQRIFMYPLVLIAATGLLSRDKLKDTAAYGLPLAVVGLLIAVYHVIVQGLQTHANIDPSVVVPCSTAGGPSCTEFYFLEFGYITIPVMSVTGFAIIVWLLYLARKDGQK